MHKTPNKNTTVFLQILQASRQYHQQTHSVAGTVLTRRWLRCSRWRDAGTFDSVLSTSDAAWSWTTSTRWLLQTSLMPFATTSNMSQTLSTRPARSYDSLLTHWSVSLPSSVAGRHQNLQTLTLAELSWTKRPQTRQ